MAQATKVSQSLIPLPPLRFVFAFIGLHDLPLLCCQQITVAVLVLMALVRITTPAKVRLNEKGQGYKHPVCNPG